MTPPHPPHRRQFLRQASRLAALAAPAAVLGAPAARAQGAGERSLSLVHTHTSERLSVVYAIDALYPEPALAALNHFLRDHYTGEVGRIDPQLFELLHRTRQALGTSAAYEVISGFRGQGTNERLRRTGGGGVATRSLHLVGQAVDVRLAGVPLDELRDAALSLKAGGVGYYSAERFVHLDTGRVRRW